MSHASFDLGVLDRALRETFGFDGFRPGQREALAALMHGGRLLCIQPTGHGKSLLYQLPSSVLPGITVVISPLLALMRDQVGQLNTRFGVEAGSINSDQSEEENEAIVEAAQTGRLRILFVAPEKLDNLVQFEFLLSLPVSLLVIDEAHCISTWGHDFRPSYRRILDAVTAFAERKPDLRVLALTATADERTEHDVAALLGTDDTPLAVHRQGMDRPNIALGLEPVRGLAAKLETLWSVLQSVEGCAVLYCSTREQTEIAAGYLSANGMDVVAYHAGLDADRKRHLQQGFTSGAVRMIAATNALGMGIDKPDIRFIAHVDVPGSITAYYQEVGRAGRDGDPATGVLLFDPADQDVQRYFIRSAQPSVEDFEVMQRVVEGAEPPLGLMAIKSRTGLHPTRVTVVLAELVEQGFVEKTLIARRQCYVWTGREGSPDLRRYRRQLQVRNQELDAMLAYGAGEPECLMQALRTALGDTDAQACGRCDRCRPEHAASRGTAGRPAVAAESWLDNRTLPIAGFRKPKMEPGVALLDGRLRGRLFADFMRGRAAGRMPPPRLLELLMQAAESLAEAHSLGSVVTVPSRTWDQREPIAALVAEHLGIPYVPALRYGNQPQARQGELKNNDQRRDNIRDCIAVDFDVAIPTGGILLLDDYVGSRATLKEAVGILQREAGHEQAIVPLTLARVQWKLGSAGML